MNAITKLSIVATAIFLTACATQSETETPVENEVVYTQTGAVTSGVETTTTTTEYQDPASYDPYYNLSNVVYFDFDQSSITHEARATLDAWAQAMTTSPRLLRLNGHADERGTREYNIALGERRAQSIAKYLISYGVSSALIETVSFGEERPAVGGTGEGSWSQNRRVEMK